MKTYRIAFTPTPPPGNDIIWAQPAGDGFTLKWLDNGQWKPFKLVDAEDQVIDPVVKIKITEGTSNGTLKVDGKNVKVHGLGTAAFTSTSTYQPAVLAGPLSEAPIDSTVGTSYFCTSTLTSENVDGSFAGVPIYWNGTTWVDFLGGEVKEVKKSKSKK